MRIMHGKYHVYFNWMESQGISSNEQVNGNMHAADREIGG